MASRSENLPVLPQVASKLLALVDDPMSSTKSIEAVLEREPAIVAKLLRVAGSAFYGGTPAGTTSRAIAVLGMVTVKSLVVGLAFQQVVASRGQSTRFNRIEFWRHSLAVASASRVIGKLLNHPQSETLYFAGLVHDIGILVLERFDKEDFDSAIQISSKEGLRLIDAENRVFNFNHGHVGEILSKKWGLNLIQSNAVRYHHAPEDEECGMSATTCIVNIADVIAHQSGFKNQSPTAADPEADEMVLEFLSLPKEQLEAIRLAVTKEVERTAELFGVAA